eukprot:CAMPEP_0170611242 /NCGR_PEP_ID=MMETSP0224-20130122/23086_1 /TAXON_ID=285029 /ORGANISM="Togula jolla, Strain CCCM 725" /LENGTH=265 /DNA_ID=CAMNT_0010936667 /DNA_START=237 /DNA_END=1034 /DNA_ORIENTATION=+
MTEMEKQADAIVHAVVAVELLDWHGKLGSTLESAFRKCVYMPAFPRLQRLTSRELSSEDFQISNGVKHSRPSRVHDSTLEKQFTLGNVFTSEALEKMGRLANAAWDPLAKYRSRQELVLAETQPEEDPSAKDLVAFTQSHVSLPNGQDTHTVADRAVGHNDATRCIWVLPVFVDHDRSAHAERQALLLLLEALPLDDDEGVVQGATGHVRVYASHTPCISCLSSMCQFTRAFEGATLEVAFDTWRQTRRWIGLVGPADSHSEEEG